MAQHNLLIYSFSSILVLWCVSVFNWKKPGLVSSPVWPQRTNRVSYDNDKYNENLLLLLVCPTIPFLTLSKYLLCSHTFRIRCCLVIENPWDAIGEKLSLADISDSVFFFLFFCTNFIGQSCLEANDRFLPWSSRYRNYFGRVCNLRPPTAFFNIHRYAIIIIDWLICEIMASTSNNGASSLWYFYPRLDAKSRFPSKSILQCVSYYCKQLLWKCHGVSADKELEYGRKILCRPLGSHAFWKKGCWDKKGSCI